MVIKDLIPDYGLSTCRTGNVYITGLADMGAEGCFLELINNLFTEKNPIVYFDHHISIEKKQSIINQAVLQGYEVYDINTDSCHSDQFDLLYSLESVEEKANIIYSFLSDKSDSSDLNNQMCRFFQDCIHALNGCGMFVSVKNIFSLKVEDVKRGIRRSRELSTSEIEDEISFLETREAYRIWGVVNDRSKKLISCGLVDVFSGRKKMDEVFNGMHLILVSQANKSSDTRKVYSSLLNGFIEMIGIICEKRNYLHKPYHLFLNIRSEMQNEQMQNLLDITKNGTFALPLCAYEQSVLKTIDSYSISVLDYFGVFCIFKNNEGTFWSEFLGTSLSPDRMETYTRKRSPVLVTMGGVVPRRDSRYEGSTVHRVEKPLYEARVFQALKDRCLILYNVYSNRKSRKQLRW